MTLSHEALELVGDPEANRLVAGPHPDIHPNWEVYHWYEMCDAVQAETYEIDGVEVSNFLLPLYFTKHEEPGSRNDFLGRLPALVSFGVSPGGYVGFSNPLNGTNNTYAPDRLGRARARIKAQAGQASRSVRYMRLGTIAGALERRGERHRNFSATRPCRSERIEGCDAFMKFRASSSGCESRPAKGEPTRAGSEPCDVPVRGPAKRRRASAWAGDVGHETYVIPSAERFSVPEGNIESPRVFLGEWGRVFGGVVGYGTCEEDGPVTWETLVHPRQIPV